MNLNLMIVYIAKHGYIFYVCIIFFSTKVRKVSIIQRILRNAFETTLVQKFSRITVYNTGLSSLFNVEAKFCPPMSKGKKE
jgi:hypothetical protein